MAIPSPVSTPFRYPGPSRSKTQRLPTIRTDTRADSGAFASGAVVPQLGAAPRSLAWDNETGIEHNGPDLGKRRWSIRDRAYVQVVHTRRRTQPTMAVITNSTAAMTNNQNSPLRTKPSTARITQMTRSATTSPTMPGRLPEAHHTQTARAIADRSYSRRQGVHGWQSEH